MQNPTKRTEPSVRRSMRSLLACKHRWKCSIEPSRNSVIDKLGIKVISLSWSLIGWEVAISGQTSIWHLLLAKTKNSYCFLKIPVSLIDLTKADWKSYILLQTAAIFFLSKRYLKHGIGSVYVMVDFICKGYLELSGSRAKRELQNQNFLGTVGFEPEVFRLRSEDATTVLRGLMSVDGMKVHVVLNVLFLEIYL